MKNQEKKTQVEVKKHDLFNMCKKDKKVTICFGNTQIDQHEFKTFQEAIKYIDSKPYELLINAACFCIEYKQKNNL